MKRLVLSASRWSAVPSTALTKPSFNEYIRCLSSTATATTVSASPFRGNHRSGAEAPVGGARLASSLPVFSSREEEEERRMTRVGGHRNARRWLSTGSAPKKEEVASKSDESASTTASTPHHHHSVPEVHVTVTPTQPAGSFRTMWKSYGLIFAGTYGMVYLGTLGSLYGLVSYEYINAVGVARVLHDVGIDKWVDVSAINSKLGHFALAWLLTKFTEPPRLAVSVLVTPLIAKFTGRGPKPQEQMTITTTVTVHSDDDEDTTKTGAKKSS